MDLKPVKETKSKLRSKEKKPFCNFLLVYIFKKNTKFHVFKQITFLYTRNIS